MKKKKPIIGFKHGVRKRPSKEPPFTEEEKRLHQERNKEDVGKVPEKWRDALRQARNSGIIGSTERTTPKKRR